MLSRSIQNVFYKVGILLPAFLFFCSSSAQQFSLKNFSVSDGLPQSQVFGLFQDNEGYIWMGTKGGGIVKFDGKKFELMFKGNRKMLFINKIVSHSNHVFIATTNGFAVYNSTTKQLYFPNNLVNAKNEPVSLVLPLTNDSVLVTTTNGVYLGHFNQLKKLKFEVREPDQIISSGIVFGNHIYIGNNYGVSKISYQNNQITIESFGRKHGLSTTAVRCFSVWENQLLIGTYGGGIFKFNKDKFQVFPINGLKSNEIVQCFLTDKSGKLWIGTSSSGVFIYNSLSKSIQQLTENEGLCRNNIISILEDDWGNIWLGSSGGGISRYNGQVFIHYNNKTGLPGKNVYSCVQTPDSTIWLGSSAPGITALKDQSINQYNAGNGFTDAKIKFLHYSSHHNKLFIGTEGDGLWTYSNNTFIREEVISEYTGKWIKHIFQDEENRLFISTASKGVICLDQDLRYSFTLNKSNHLPNNRINSSVYANGHLWIATEGDGLVYYNENNHNTTIFTTKNKIPSNIIRCLELDEYNRVWIGTPSGTGYFTTKNPVFTPISLPDGHQNIYLLTHKNSTVYFGSAKGLVKKNYSENTLLTTSTFTYNEGFNGIECSQNGVGHGINNTILFGTINGLSIFQPAFEQFNNLAPRLSFVQVNLFYENLLNKQTALNHPVFNYQQNHLGFKFIGINQLNPDGVKYQWKLEGLEIKWSPLTSTNEVNFTNLVPGDYQFKVRACNENGIWTNKLLTFKFEITKPWFRENWFYVTILVATLILLIGIYYLLTQNNRKKQERERQRLLLENKLLEIQQMALRLQMNPHFIFNCLNSIQNLVSQNRNEDSNFYIQKFSGLMRGMVDLTPRETIPLDRELKLLESYLELEQLNRSNTFEYEITTQLQDSPDFYRIPPLLLQPFAENAIVHGFKGIAYKGKIKFLIKDDGNKLTISIQDNGIGIEEEIHLPEERNSAIKITTERLNLFNKQKGHWIYILKNNGDGKGIKVELTLNFV